MLTLAGQLRRLYKVSFICPPSEAGQILLKRADGLGCKPLAVNLAEGRSTERQLQKWFCENGVDLLHCHAGISWEGHQAIRIARVAGVSAILRTEHLPYLLTDAQQQLEHRKLVDLIDRLICVSDEARQSFLNQGFSREKFVTVRNGITIFPFRNRLRDIHDRLKLDSQLKIVLTVARFTEQKGHDYLLQAIPNVIAIQPSAHFVWVGTGPLEATLQKTARDLRMEEHISFLGSRDDARELVAGADVFVLPSRFEGLPLVLLEAMAVGVPVIGTRVCGIQETVRDGVSGRLVPSADSKALAGAILEVLEQPETAAKRALRARTRVKRRFNAARMARETIAIYRELLPSAEPAAAPINEVFA